MAYAKRTQQPVSPGDSIEFQAEAFHYAISDAELLDDLRGVAERLSNRTVFPQQYQKHGRFSPETLRARFGSWAGALERGGLEPSHPQPVQREAILRDIAEVAKKLRKNDVSRTDYRREGRFGTTTIKRDFGTWVAAKQAAGLNVVVRPTRNPTNQQLFENFEQVWRALGHQPRGQHLSLPPSRHGLCAYRNRFGTFRKALAAFLAWRAQSSRVELMRDPREEVMKHKTKREVTAALRYRILRRDHFRCRCCGRSPAIDPAVQLHIDHIHPWSAGGETVEENLQTLCGACNGGKGDIASVS